MLNNLVVSLSIISLIIIGFATPIDTAFADGKQASSVAEDSLGPLKLKINEIEKAISTTSKIQRAQFNPKYLLIQKKQNDALSSQNWADYTEAALDMALFEGDWYSARSHIIYGLIRQKKFEQALYINDEICRFDSGRPLRHKGAKPVTLRDVEHANILAARGDGKRADNLFQSLIKKELITKNDADLLEARQNYANFLRRQSRAADAIKVELAIDGKSCPICHKDDETIPIHYGLPAGPVTDDVKLGGCMVSENSPHWWCKRDKSGF